MTDKFMEDYILSLFNKETQVTAKQLSLIANGKRTPSVLFNVEKNRLYALFGLFPELSMKDWEALEASLIERQLLTKDDEHLKLSPMGSRVKETFIEEFRFENDLDLLRFSSTKRLFWRRFIFITQIFSEYSYHNKQYVPYLSTIENQSSIKEWLVKQGETMDELTLNWFEELNELFHLISTDHSNFIAGHFVGYERSGSTSRQIQDTFELSAAHYKVLIDQLSYQIAQIGNNEFPMLSSLWKKTHEDCDEGLSHSARLSKKWLEKGRSIGEIADSRKLKSNTIKEHILECVLVTDWSNYHQYIDDKHYAQVNSLFESNPSLKYKEAKSVIEGLDFFSFRLVEIERVRHYEKES